MSCSGGADAANSLRSVGAGGLKEGEFLRCYTTVKPEMTMGGSFEWEEHWQTP